MRKVLSFMAGMLAGALVGGTITLLLTPASGEELIEEIESRWHAAVDEAHAARIQKERELELQFELAKRG
jgi:gas vesicle protein